MEQGVYVCRNDKRRSTSPSGTWLSDALPSRLPTGSLWDHAGLLGQGRDGEAHIWNASVEARRVLCDAGERIHWCNCRRTLDNHLGSFHALVSALGSSEITSDSDRISAALLQLWKSKTSVIFYNLSALWVIVHFLRVDLFVGWDLLLITVVEWLFCIGWWMMHLKFRHRSLDVTFLFRINITTVIVDIVYRYLSMMVTVLHSF